MTPATKPYVKVHYEEYLCDVPMSVFLEGYAWYAYQNDSGTYCAWGTAGRPGIVAYGAHYCIFITSAQFDDHTRQGVNDY